MMSLHPILIEEIALESELSYVFQVDENMLYYRSANDISDKIIGKLVTNNYD